MMRTCHEHAKERFGGEEEGDDGIELLRLAIARVRFLPILRGGIIPCAEALLEILHELRVVFARLPIGTVCVVHHSSQQVEEELLEFVSTLLRSLPIL